MESLAKVTEFFWDYIGFRHEIKMLASELLLHPTVISAETVFSSEFCRIYEVIDLLNLVQSLINVGFGRCAVTGPQNIPIV